MREAGTRRRRASRRLSAAAMVVASGFAITGLTGCSGTAHPQALTVVASTDVWGSVARAVAGRRVAVKSILSGSDIDPHSYEASPSDTAAVTDATLVVYNGGGYDPWIEQVLSRHPAANAVDAYAFVKGTRTDGQPPNEHVFYDLDVARSVASTIADRMAALDPRNAADYRANAAEFCRGADAVTSSEHAIASAYPRAGVIMTEQVGYYLLASSGLIDRSPAAFTEANENETDPSPADMASVLDLIDHRRVAALLVNPQTSTPAIDSVEKEARRAGVPEADITETLPDGSDYLTWQRDTVSRLQTALRSGRQADLS